MDAPRVRLARYDRAWLKSATARLTARLRAGEGDPRRRRALEARDAEEQRELERATERGVASGRAPQLPGRQTGSLAWRAARGELGADPAAEAAAAAAAAAAADAAASPWAPADASATGDRATQLPGVKPLPDELVAAAATRVSASAGRDKLDVLRRVLTNVVNDPTNGKYRRLKMSNAKIAAAVGGGTFGKELLVALGFVAKNDAKDGLVFVLGPGGADVSAAVPAIQLALGKMEEGNANKTPGATGVGGEGGEGGSGSAVNAVARATGKLSIEANGAPATESASTPAPAASAAASSGDLAKEALRKAVHAEFTRLVDDEGVAANEAAAMAINSVRAKMTAKAATATPEMVAASPNVAR